MILVANDGSFSIDFSKTTDTKHETTTDTKSVAEESLINETKLEPEEITLGKYRHVKGNEYEVLGFAKDSETTEMMNLFLLK